MKGIGQDSHILITKAIIYTLPFKYTVLFGFLQGATTRTMLLLENEDSSIIAAIREDQIVADAIANKSDGAVGISNVFTSVDDQQMYWQGFINMIVAHYPGLPIVGYERDDSLKQTLQVGFAVLGPLTIWLKEVVQP